MKEYTANEMMLIKEPLKLFNLSGDIQKQFKSLAKKWHPDLNKDKKSSEVFTHIKTLYDKAIEISKSDQWISETKIKLKDEYDNEYIYDFQVNHKFELGNMYINDTFVLYVIDNNYRILYDNAKKVISNKFVYASERMRSEIRKYLPNIIKSFKTIDNKLVIEISKTSDLLLLKDVSNYFKNKTKIIDPKYIAWIISSMYNLVCYFNYANLVQSGISIDNYFISFKYHSGALLGGWWYTVEKGNKLIGVSGKNYPYLPLTVKRDKVSNSKLDLELIKIVGRELLGDISGVTLSKLDRKLKPMIDWFLYPATNEPVDEYHFWHKEVLVNTFGPHKFIKFNLTAQDLYERKEI